MKPCKKHTEEPNYNCDDCISYILFKQEEAIKENLLYIVKKLLLGFLRASLKNV